MTQPPPNHDDDEFEEAQSAASTTKSHQGSEAISKVLGTQEIMSSIYEFYFEGIELRPLWREAGSDHNYPFKRSRLALLLLCRSQMSETRKIMMKNAIINLWCVCDLAAVIISKSDLDQVQIVRCGPGVCKLRRPLLTGNVLMKFQNLKSLLLDFPTFVVVKFNHNNLLAETKDSSTRLRKVAAAVVKKTQWIKDLLTVATPYEVSVQCSICPRESADDFDPLMTEDRGEIYPARFIFTPSTQILTESHNGEVYSVVQGPVQNLVHVSEPIVKHDLSALLGDKVWDIVNDLFSDVELLPINVGRLFSEEYSSEEYSSEEYSSEEYSSEEYSSDDEAKLALESQTFQQEKYPELSWRIGQVLLSDWTCSYSCPCVRRHSGWQLSGDNLWDLWRRLLNVDNKEVFERPWKGAYKLIWDLKYLHGGVLDDEPLSQIFKFEKRFFTLLFDPDRPWMVEEDTVSRREAGSRMVEVTAGGCGDGTAAIT